jgi:hypothetical protein
MLVICAAEVIIINGRVDVTFIAQEVHNIPVG